jgi:Protein of unknown function (DUF402)
MVDRWSAGSVVALREIWRGRLWTARAAIVVEDSPARTMFFVPPGMRWKCPVSPGGGWQRVPSDHWLLGDRVWRRTSVLSFAWPGVAHAALLHWNASDGRFAGWYVNLQTPLTRSPIGFDYMDHVLDIEVAPDRTWSWKDEDELRGSVDRGLFTPRQAAEIRAEGKRAIRRLDARLEPFDDAWIGWRPDPRWRMPELPAGWSDLSR